MCSIIEDDYDSEFRSPGTHDRVAPGTRPGPQGHLRRNIFHDPLPAAQDRIRRAAAGNGGGVRTGKVAGGPSVADPGAARVHRLPGGRAFRAPLAEDAAAGLRPPRRAAGRARGASGQAGGAVTAQCGDAPYDPAPPSPMGVHLRRSWKSVWWPMRHCTASACYLWTTRHCRRRSRLDIGAGLRGATEARIRERVAVLANRSFPPYKCRAEPPTVSEFEAFEGCRLSKWQATK